MSITFVEEVDVESVTTTTSSLRDVHGYPRQGYDFVPERPKPKYALSDTVKLLEHANEREDALKRMSNIGVALTTVSTRSI